MHDHLPIQLFTLENFDSLSYAEQYTATAFFPYFVLVYETISAKDLSIDERVDFLEIVTYYCNFYKKLYEDSSKKTEQIKKEKKMCFIWFRITWWYDHNSEHY